MGSLFCCFRGPAMLQEHGDSDDNEQLQESDATNNSDAYACSILENLILRCGPFLGSGSMGASSFSRARRGLRVDPKIMDFKIKGFVPQISRPEEDCTISDYNECLICLEEYSDENPRIPTKCSHHYHLSCMLEWQQRCKFCPVCCSKEMEFELIKNHSSSRQF